MSKTGRQGYGRWIAGCLVVGICFAAPATAATFFEDVQDSLACTSLATPDERASLRADWLSASDAAGQRRYFGASRAGSREFHFRYLTLLQAVANLADEVDDQVVRQEVLARILQYTARPELEAATDPLFRQVQRCAWFQAVESVLASRDRSLLGSSLQRLLASYRSTRHELPVEDWPLILALRDVRKDANVSPELAGLAALALERGNFYEGRQERERAQRAWLAAARGLFELGEAQKAYQAAMAGVRADAAGRGSQSQRWGAYPVLFDFFMASGRIDDAAGLDALFQGDFKPPDPRDHVANFEVFQRLARAADSVTERYINDAAFRGRTSSEELNRRLSQSGEFGPAADREMKGGHLSLTSLRRAQRELTEQAWEPDFLPQLTRADPNHAPELARSYLDMARKQTATHLKSGMLVSKRERVIYRRQYSRLIGDVAKLLPYVQRERSELVEQSFALAQMASHNGASAVATSGLMGLNRSGVTADSLTWNLRMIENPAAYLQTLLAAVEAAYPAGAAANRNVSLDSAWQRIVLTRSDVFENREQFAVLLYQRHPELAAFTLGAPFPVATYQKFLGPRDALVATHVASDAVHVWVLTAREARLASTSVAAGEVDALVARVRASVEQAVKDPLRQQIAYDADAAWKLFRLTFEPVMAQVAGSTRVYWYGDKALAALPPAILLTKAPAKPQLATLAELKSASFLASEFPLVSMPELSVYPLALSPSRKLDATRTAGAGPEFLGIGATGLSAQELQAGSFSRSLDLAGAGTAAAPLADLPKLEETVSQLRAIERSVGADRSTLWLGPDATRKKLLDADLTAYRVLVIATHGFLPGEMQRCGIGPYPSLMLSPVADSTAPCKESLLTTRDISQLKLNADLVVLSACNTARSGSRGGVEDEPFLGLAASFGAAGARNLAVSHWPVLIGAASDLTAGMIGGTKAGDVALDVSLQQSIARLRATAQSALEAHPAYWGPFVLVGSGRSTLRGE